MARRPVGSQPQYDSRVLDSLIGKVKLGSHSPHILPLGVHQKLFHPVYRDHLGVIVQKQQIGAPGFCSAKIVDRRIVKGFSVFLPVCNDSYPVIFFKFLIIIENFLVTTVIFHHNHFIILVGRLLQDGRDTSFQIRRMVLVSNNNWYFRASNDLIANLENRLKGSGGGNPEMFKAMPP